MTYLYLFFCLAFAIAFFCVTLICLKKRKIEFGFGCVWFAISIFLFVIAVQPYVTQAETSLLDKISAFLGMVNGTSFLFACGVIFNLVVTYYLTLKISESKRKIITLTQEIGILKTQLGDERTDDVHSDGG